MLKKSTRYQLVASLLIALLSVVHAFADEGKPGDAKKPEAIKKTDPPAAPVFPDEEKIEVLKEGQFKCYPGRAPVVCPYCTYNSKPLGKRVFDQILQKAQSRVSTREEGQFDKCFMRPTPTRVEGEIQWNLNDEQGNLHMGLYLQQIDSRTAPRLKDKVILTSTLYMFRSGYEREFSLELGAFYGERTLTEKPGHFVGEVLGGIFKSAFSIGNPLSSALEIAIRLSNDKKRSKTVSEIMYVCNEGDSCEYAHEKKHYFTGNFSGFETNAIGFRMSATPVLYDEDKNLIGLEDFQLKFALPTEEEKSPVDVIQPFNYRQLQFRANEIYVLGAETSQRDVFTGKLIGSGETKKDDRLLVLMRGAIHSFKNPEPEIRQHVIQKLGDSYSDQELKALPKDSLSLKAIFDSLKLVCFDDYVNPTFHQICGFQFTKMDQRFVDYQIEVKIDAKAPALFSSTPVGALKYPEFDKKKMHRLGAFYGGKGYLQIPLLQGEGAYTVRIELAETDSSLTKLRRNKARASKDVIGVQFEFDYIPTSKQPIEPNLTFTNDNWIQ